jgi:hypothetical protein
MIVRGNTIEIRLHEIVGRNAPVLHGGGELGNRPFNDLIPRLQGRGSLSRNKTGEGDDECVSNHPRQYTERNLVYRVDTRSAM